MIKGIKDHLFAIFVFATALFASVATTAQAATLPVPEPPDIKGRSYVIMEADTGQVLAASNEHEEYAPASLTKMMTTYVVEHEIASGRISMDDWVPISVKAWKTQGSRMFVREGTQVKLSDLLRGSIIQSGNDASVALAEYVAGSEAAFAELMNQHAQRLGMRNSNFVNATGLPAKNHYSSAYDLALLGRAIAKEFPAQYKIYGEKSFTYNDIKQPNRNKLLFRDPNVDGIKTGWTEDAGYCMVASSIRDGMRLVTTVMGTSSANARAQESQKLLAYGFRFYERYPLVQANAVLLQDHVWGGQTDRVNVGIQEDLTLVMQRGADLETNMEVDAVIEAPILEGQVLGKVVVRLDGEILKEVPLVALNAVEAGGFFKRLWDSMVRFLTGLFG